MLPVIVRILQSLYIRTGSIYRESMPLVFHHQEATVRLVEILNTKLYERAMTDIKMVNQELDDAVFTPLRENFELVFPERGILLRALH